MATAQKSTIRRFNGVDWDPIYLATTSDIVALGKAATIEAMTEVPFKYNDVLEIGDNIADLLITVISRMATLDADVIPGLASGSSITSLAADKIDGVISRENLPEDVGGKGLEVASEDDKDALTAKQVNVGDIVKVTGGKVYQVTGYTTTGEGEAAVKTPTYMAMSDDAGEVVWTRITGTPTTLGGYGITDAVNVADTVDHGTKTEGDADTFTAAGKVVKANADGKLDFDVTGDAATVGGKTVAELAMKTDVDAINTTIGNVDTAGTLKGDIATLQDELKNQDASWIKSGVLDLKVIPKVALSEMHVVSGEDQLPNLTTAQVQQGDTVKIADEVDVEGNITTAGKMYYVADETKLGTADWEDAFMPYTAAEASAVQWAGVLNKPTTLAGYGITDAVNSSMVTDTAEAGKLLKLNADGKFDADITGDAATLGGHAADYFATAADLTTTNGNVTTLETALNTLRDEVLGTGEEGTSLADRVKTVEDAIGDTSTEGSILAVLETLKSGEGIAALAASKLTGTVSRANLPADVGGRLIEVSDLENAYDTLTADNAAAGDLVKLDSSAVYMVVDTAKLGEAAGYKVVVDVAAANIAWNKITGTPTTLAGYGITDAVNTADVVTDGILATDADPATLAGKIVALGADAKLHANLAGDAATVGGKSVNELASKEAFDELSLRVPLIADSLDAVENPQAGQYVLIPVTSNTIVTNLDTGEQEPIDSMSAASNYSVGGTDGEGSEKVDTSKYKTESI